MINERKSTVGCMLQARVITHKHKYVCYRQTTGIYIAQTWIHMFVCILLHTFASVTISRFKKKQRKCSNCYMYISIRTDTYVFCTCIYIYMFLCYLWVLRYIHITSINFTFVLNIDYGLVSRFRGK